VFEVFFGGARGGGKTDGMLGECIKHAELYGEHAIGLMIRRTRHRADYRGANMGGDHQHLAELVMLDGLSAALHDVTGRSAIT
jgi:hypothetical protein